MISRSLKSLVFLLILAISAAGVQLCLDGKIFAATEDEIMEEIMEEIMDDVSEEINDSIKEEVRDETNEVVSEETTSPFSGTYVSGPLTLQYIISGSSYQVTGSSASGCRLVTHSGTIEGNNTSFTVTFTEIALCPPFTLPCTESGNATGVFSGSGEPGTTHTIMLPIPTLCTAPVPSTVFHIKQ